MIKSFTHRGLERFYSDGSKKGIKPEHAKRLMVLLDRLNLAETVADMNYPGANLHPLHGPMKGAWSVTVSGNWRVTFTFERGDAFNVDYVDYH